MIVLLYSTLHRHAGIWVSFCALATVEQAVINQALRSDRVPICPNDYLEVIYTNGMLQVSSIWQVPW